MPSPPHLTFQLDGQKIIERRIELGLLQKDLAQLAGISAQFLNDVERGRRGCSPPVRLRIADALDTTVRSLAQGEA